MRNFDLRIRGGADAGYLVEVTASPAGETPQPAPMPALPQDDGVQAALRDLRDFRAAPEVVRDLGDVLWRALFQPSVVSRYAESLGLAGDVGLRIRLRIDPIELQLLPWEYLHDPETEQFVALSRRTSLVRYVARPQPAAPLQVDGPLRILVLISAPSDQPPLQVDRERQLIQAALGPQVEAGAVDLTVETDGRVERLQERLRQGVHVLHYVGHGMITGGQGYLVLEDEAGTSRLVGAPALEPLLGGTSLRCVVLAACESATTPGDPFLGLAPALVRGGVPAVVAMQMSVPDESAVVFSREFYRSLAQRWPIDACVTEGRLGVRAAVRETRIDWGIPTLFTRSDDGQLFAADTATPANVARDVLPEASGPAGRSGGIDIRDSTVTFGGDVAGRDMFKTSDDRAADAGAPAGIVGSIWRALRRLFGS